MIGRVPFAYVVAVDGAKVTLNLREEHRGHYVAHQDGVTAIAEIGALFAVDGGTQLFVMRVRSIEFAEPKEAHREAVGSSAQYREPLRLLVATVAGVIRKQLNGVVFFPDSLATPPLGGSAYPLLEDEVDAVLGTSAPAGNTVELGESIRGNRVVNVGVNDLLGRHVAVLGGTGQGKTCLTAALLQQILRFPQPRIVVFDVNGEYTDAIEPHCRDNSFKKTVLGSAPGEYKIPYYALGRHGLSRLLLPSERTQRPALNFALENLNKVTSHEGGRSASLAGDDYPILFDDCRQDEVQRASEAIERLRRGEAQAADEWPHMGALGCLIAESYAIRINRYGQPERSAFDYNNIAPLVTRLRRHLDDPQFQNIVNTEGGPPEEGANLSWELESARLVTRVFGQEREDWKVHLIDLRQVAHDLMPLVLGSLLELLAFELFRRGQNSTYPTLLVLEEAHHYLRQPPGDESVRSHLAYERLAKEGRKFGLSLWVSTQRPAEVSPTVLAQCGAWIVFRLTAQSDLATVGAAGEWVAKDELVRIAGLPRQQALVFGSSVPVPVRVLAARADPLPRSHDPDFGAWLAPPDP